MGHVFKKIDLEITDSSIQSYARKYLDLRSRIVFDPSSLNDDPRFKDFGFSADKIKDIIQEATTPIRESDQPYRDIYRSDLGELLLTAYFDKEYPEHGNEEFIIPLKNIWDRELSDLPGRGFDVVGYKTLDDNKLELLLGEGKVSTEQKSPPRVVHTKSDSIYKTQKSFVDDKKEVIRKLSNHVKKLDAENALPFSILICAIESEQEDVYRIIYGCCLVRDDTCVDDEKDYGKLQSNRVEFEPGKVHFVMPTFNIKIEEAVDRFHKAVQNLNGGSDA